MPRKRSAAEIGLATQSVSRGELLFSCVMRLYCAFAKPLEQETADIPAPTQP